MCKSIKWSNKAIKSKIIFTQVIYTNDLWIKVLRIEVTFFEVATLFIKKLFHIFFLKPTCYLQIIVDICITAESTAH